MKQVIQSLRSGELAVEEVPAPIVVPGRVLVKNRFSFVSPGTERANREIAKSSLLEKARQRPDQVKKVLEKIQTEGFSTTFQKVKSRLEEPVPLGYSCAGEVIAVGEGVEGLFPGDRVACAGAGYANHAEIVCVPKNLVAKIPEGVADEEACAATLCAIALQGVRVADLRLGEAVGVIGLGLLGQIVVQLLKANGCQVFGIDLDSDSVDRARSFGADLSAIRSEDVEKLALSMTQGEGLDAVILTAATDSNDPVELAGTLCRRKGRVVAVGTLPMNIPRRIYYPKELELRLSTSYGPGRYDPEYEERGKDYPYAYVRFTEQRNLETALSLMAEGKLKIAPLVTHSFSIEDAKQAYALVEGETEEKSLGILFRYDEKVESPTPPSHQSIEPKDQIQLGILGAGQFASGVLLPRIQKISGVAMSHVITGRGATASTVAKRYEIANAGCDPIAVYQDPSVDVVLIATRHHLHAEQTIASVDAGKHVFVEKPLALNREDLSKIREAVERKNRVVMVGFNRRFSPMAREVKQWFEPRTGPLAMLARINAGRLEKGSWLLDPAEGGGRIVGEVCHFVDLFQYWSGSRVEDVQATCLHSEGGDQNISVLLRFTDGSTATLVYTAEGAQAVPKEFYEVHSEGKSAQLDDFKMLTLSEGNKSHTSKSRAQDKGHTAELEHFFDCLKTGKIPELSFESCVETTETTFRILDAIRGL
ncbi:MAG: bi-domain-containing oxidoreductase [Candidatus Omnitrophica bacterium]|nr:bi-domain-containing oxidoreductase [Candidatus Omnitrophota bacterium]